jgi:hypothetical protein
MSQFELDNAIANLSDLPMPNNGVAALCEALAKGWKEGHVIMYGPKGSGKTTMADLLPKAIAPDVAPLEIMYADPAAYNVQTFKRLAKSFMRTIGLNCKEKVFIIFDEFGAVTDASVKTLNKALTDYRKNCMAIFITNDIETVAPSIASRCYKADFTNVNYRNYVPYAESVLRKYGFTNINQAALDRVVRANCTDLRELMRALEDIILNARQPQLISVPAQPQNAITIALPAVMPPSTASVAALSVVAAPAAVPPVVTASAVVPTVTAAPVTTAIPTVVAAQVAATTPQASAATP